MESFVVFSIIMVKHVLFFLVMFLKDFHEFWGIRLFGIAAIRKTFFFNVKDETEDQISISNLYKLKGL